MSRAGAGDQLWDVAELDRALGSRAKARGWGESHGRRQAGRAEAAGSC